MLSVAVEGLVADIVQVVEPLVSWAVLLLTVTFSPTKLSAWVAWAVCCSDTRLDSCSLDLSCCSTWANATSCWVNWLVSSGLVGSWFLSCVVSSVRKVWKLPAIVLVSMPVDDDEELDDDGGVVAAVTVLETPFWMLV